ncbi:hypothetical protein H920_13370 [Fukomys damarensis]|uniref:Uncharacterized protein n=1 Tax=Fukomys damarensis TaxID=885580 RepID=A0A091CZD5_FUKDA|nr:hypothetical protein H920_13370 [Fukomys damarensis]
MSTIVATPVDEINNHRLRAFSKECNFTTILIMVPHGAQCSHVEEMSRPDLEHRLPPLWSFTGGPLQAAVLGAVPSGVEERSREAARTTDLCCLKSESQAKLPE